MIQKEKLIDSLFDQLIIEIYDYITKYNTIKDVPEALLNHMTHSQNHINVGVSRQNEIDKLHNLIVYGMERFI